MNTKIKPIINVIIENEQPVTTSLNVSEIFGREHRVVLKAIDDLKGGLAQKYADLFWEDTYTHPQNKQNYRMVYMNKDGFSLLVMGFSNTEKVLTVRQITYINDDLTLRC